MKIKLLSHNRSTVPVPLGAVGEALKYRITANSVVLECAFYGHTGIHEVDIRDARSLTDTR